MLLGKRSWPLLALAALLGALLGAPAVDAQVVYAYRADLRGAQVVPPTSSPGIGALESFFDSAAPCGSYPNDPLRVWMFYVNLEGTPTGCFIHRGAPGMNGERLYTVFPGWFPSGSTATLMVNTNDCPDFENYLLYVVITTDRYPGGEIRGQIYPSALPVEPSTWGMIKAMYD